MLIADTKVLNVVREKYDFSDNDKGYTQGKMYHKGKFLCYTLEDERRDKKVYGQTCIPAGIYPIGISKSSRFGRDMPIIRDVPGFEGIRIHGGNTAKNTEGCILVAHTLIKDGHIYKTAEKSIMAFMLANDIRYINIVDTEPLP